MLVNGNNSMFTQLGRLFFASTRPPLAAHHRHPKCSVLHGNKAYQNKHKILTNLLFLDLMWTVKDGEVGQSTTDAELPTMLRQKHVQFHDVGPSTGQYQSPNKRFFFSVPAVLWHYTNVGQTMALQYIANGHFSYFGPLLVQCIPNRPKRDIGPTICCYLGSG
jgi:hypothetical protein